MNVRYVLDGPSTAPVLVLPSSLGTSIDLWEANLRHWPSFRVLRYDQAGNDSIDGLGQDLLRLLDALELERVSVCGLSLGGATAMWFAANAGERVERLVLACTSATFGEPGPWLERATLVRTGGLEPIADSILANWFTASFAVANTETVARFKALLTGTPREPYARCCEAIARWDFREQLTEVRAPTLVIAAAEDPSTPQEHAELIAARIDGAKLAVLPHAAHLANVEQPEAFAALVSEHVASVEVA
jgi:3-oxoadipate enol-lactonase